MPVFIQTTYTRKYSNECATKNIMHKSTHTFVRSAGGEPACGGDVIIFVLREVVLDFFNQGEASGKGSRSWGGGGLGEEAAGSPQGWGGGIQRGKMKVGATQRRSRKHIILKVQGCPTCWGLCAKMKGHRWARSCSITELQLSNRGSNILKLIYCRRPKETEWIFHLWHWC